MAHHKTGQRQRSPHDQQPKRNVPCLVMAAQFAMYYYQQLWWEVHFYSQAKSEVRDSFRRSGFFLSLYRIFARDFSDSRRTRSFIESGVLGFTHI
jgi:hypothetical protein